MMKLYYSPGACSLVPHILLNELGLDYQLIKVDLSSKTCSEGSFLQINPKGYVPYLQIDQGLPKSLTEVAVILQYLGELRPELNLIPPQGDFKRYQCLEWVHYVATEIHKGFTPLFAADKMFQNKEVIDDVKNKYRNALDKKLKWLNEELTNDYLMGEQISIADFYLYVTLSWSKFVQLDIRPYSNLMKFMEKMKNRPSTQKALRAEGLI